MNAAATRPTLVIGWGNVLRGDDGVGRQVAERVRAAHPPGVRVMSLHQPVPELAADMAAVDRVVLLDASMTADRVTARRVVPGNPAGSGALGHALTPEGLAGLTLALYQARPEIWAIPIPARWFGMGDPLSAATAAHADLALDLALDLIARAPVPATVVEPFEPHPVCERT